MAQSLLLAARRGSHVLPPSYLTQSLGGTRVQKTAVLYKCVTVRLRRDYGGQLLQGDNESPGGLAKAAAY